MELSSSEVLYENPIYDVWDEHLDIRHSTLIVRRYGACVPEVQATAFFEIHMRSDTQETIDFRVQRNVTRREIATVDN